MNLTYDDEIYYADVLSRGRGDVGQALAGYTTYMETLGVDGLGDLGSIVSKLIKFKKKITPKPLRKLVDAEAKTLKVVGKNAKFIAPIASVFGPIGMAVGAAVTLVGADYNRAQQQAANLKATKKAGSELIAQYEGMAGTVPGRLIGDSIIKDVFSAYLGQGTWNGTKYDASKRKARVGNLMSFAKQAVQSGIARGATSLLDIYNTDWPSIIASKANDQAAFTPTTIKQAQLIIDALDSALASAQPSSTISYGVATQATPTASSATTASSTTASGATTASDTSAADVNSAMIAAMQQMAAQGASSQAINSQILSALSAQGVTVDSDQAAAISSAADQTAAGQVVTAGVSGVPTWLMIGLGVGAVLLATAHPKRGKRGR